ncbi:MAG: HPF/RaiA family ribosome-associated protein [Steroidobacteraceae bacterium]
MKIDVQARQFALTAPLRDAVQLEIDRLVDALGARITRISVRLFDINGLRGGPDKGCMVHAHFADGVTIVASDVGEDLYRSVPAAFDKLLLRRRRLGDSRRVARRRLPDGPLPMPA